MSDAAEPSRIFVVGSLAWTRALVPSDSRRQYARHEGWVGAPIIRDMIIQALVEKDDAEIAQLCRVVLPNSLNGSPGTEAPAAPLSWIAGVGELTAVFKDFPKSAAAKKSDTVLRLETNYRETSKAAPDIGPYLAYSLETIKTPLGASDLVVAYDHDGHFLDAFGSALTHGNVCKGATFVLAIGGAFKPESAKATFESLGAVPERTVLVLSAMYLRTCGVNIAEYGSLERTIKDIVRCVNEPTGPLSQILEHCVHAVIPFEEAGAACLRRLSDGAWTGSYHFCPNFDDVALAEPKRFGKCPSHTAITLAAVAAQIYADGAVNDLAPSLRLASAAYNMHFTEGFDRTDPFRSVKESLCLARRNRLREGLLDPKDQGQYLASSMAFVVDDPAKKNRWTRLGACWEKLDEAGVKKELRALVRNGPEHVFRDRKASCAASRWSPPSSITCPFLKVGAIRTFDPAEIDGFLALSRLIKRYVASPATKPLSIAVFGAPGSGKSLAVKELLESVRPGSRDGLLTYNLSQFDSPSLLTESFHQIQDRALSSGQSPLVMFDEFDCVLNKTQLGWLKYFLAPMQDGEFQGKSGTYKIGSAIFFFAGGTSETFDKFQDRLDPEGEYSEEMKDAKLKDFVSRLVGYLDVQDINPPTDGSPDLNQLERRVKRALTLRFQLAKHTPEIVQEARGTDPETLNITDDMIDAFLDVKRYAHGVRSMEAVVRMSRAVGGRFVPASLPSQEQLGMHTTSFLSGRG